MTATFRDADGMSLGVRSEAVYFDPDEAVAFRMALGEGDAWRDVETVELSVRPSACLEARK
ncbi:hypothetical protein BRD00_00215 [Halobacteriales archaeon QS_8_69_26]|nr:MAG: hypothetical protein BRD00_00215 [Halobacteriales archaeon QS_8_69_26]